MENDRVADIFQEIADLLELKDANEFRVRSYRDAARTVRDLSDRLEDLAAQGEDLSELPNVGKKTATKIREILDKGTCRRLEELRDEMPESLTEVMKVPHVGPRKAMQIYKELGVEDLDALQEACEEGRVRELEGFGERMEEKILQNIQTVRSTAGRVLYAEAERYVTSLGELLDRIDAIKRWEIAGSFRRCKETVGDLDFLIEAKDRNAASEAILDHEEIRDTLVRGEERVSVKLESGLQVDFRFFEPAAFGSALLYFTGSKDHSIRLRRRVLERDWTLNEYGLFKDDNRLAGKTEAAIYSRLNLPWIPPELREDRGEIDAAAADELPALIEPGELRGDLHAHTDASDGDESLQAMVRAAMDRDYQYLAITDHSSNVSVTQGLDDDGARRHADDIREEDGRHRSLWLLAGVEVDILKSGKLDLKAKTLADLDWVVASVHSYWDLSEQKMTERLVAAVESGVVHCLGHPLGRQFGKRDPIVFEAEKVFAACAEHGVCLEIDSQPMRLDLPDTYCQQAREHGLRFCISSDAHKGAALDMTRYGVNEARRGWLERRDVLNTRTRKQLRKWLAKD